MTIPFVKRHYVSRLAATPADVTACQRLRHLCFFGRAGVDIDRFDARYQHLMVEDVQGRLAATVRFSLMHSGADVMHGYAGQSYDLSGLASASAPTMEVGRFCSTQDVLCADILRVAWGALTQIVDQHQVTHLFGCTSFRGTDPAPYGLVFARLAANHQGPATLQPVQKAAEVIPLAKAPAGDGQSMPPLLRSYLAMGGWVGDHAVVDRRMQTLHVFTCLDVAAVPPARARALRAVMG